MTRFWSERLSPFQHKSFRYFFSGHMISLVGSWSHEIARSWLVLEIAGTATALGSLLLSLAIPGFILTIYGGSIADRKDAIRVLKICKWILACSALTFAALVEFTEIKLWVIFLFAIIEGCVNSFDGPAFTSVFARMVPQEDFRQALALNSSNFHVSRMLGPVVAAILMAVHGPSLVFLFDSISYLAVIFVLGKVHLRPKNVEQFSPTVDASGPLPPAKGEKIKAPDLIKILSSFRFFFRNPDVRYKQLQFIFSICFIIPLINLVFRTYLKQKFNLNAQEFGFMFSFPAIGSMCGAFYIILASMKDPIKNLIVGIPAVIICLMSIEHIPSPGWTSIVLACCGFFSYLNVASITQSMHIETPDEYRGRLGSIITLGFGSIGPLMSFPIGVYTDSFGYEVSIQNTTLLYALLSLTLAYLNFRRRPQDVLP